MVTQILAMTLTGLSLAMMTLAFLLSKKNTQDLEKNSQFECGFNPLTTFRNSFSLQFFLITIIFLIFDVEIALLLPSMVAMTETGLLNWACLLLVFTMILILGIVYEWQDMSLEWK